MQTIKTKAELVELLFQELDASKPRQEVDPSFPLRVGGLCHGIVYGGFHDNPPYLEDMFSIHYGDREPTTTGTRLIAFARSLADAGWADPTCVWTLTQLLRLMLAALNSKDLEVRDDHKTGRRYLVSTAGFAARRGCQVRVRLGRATAAPPNTAAL